MLAINGDFCSRLESALFASMSTDDCKHLQLCVTFTAVMTRHTPHPANPDEPLLAWFNAAAREHQHGIAEMIEGLGDA